jgi:hypothetical protein
MEMDNRMALEIEVTMTVNLSIEADNPDATEEEIKAAILTLPLSTFDIGECLKVTCNYGGPDLGWTDENSSVYAYGVTNVDVDKWVLAQYTPGFSPSDTERIEPVYGDSA